MKGCCRWLLSAALLSVVVGVGAAGSEPEPAGPMLGFRAEAAASQRALEQRFDEQLDPAELTEWLKLMSAEANHVGSAHNLKNARWVRDQFEKWGWRAKIETFDVLYPTPKEHSLEMIGPRKFVASLKEPVVPGDATSSRTDSLPPYAVYGADGDVTGPLVYVNYGMPDDYKELARRGIDVKGKIVIARYGRGWRGLKPKLAYEHGAIGCLIYSDPKDDGYGQGDIYPDGAWRPSMSVQRGSVADMPVYPGDPLTPGIGATKGAQRLKVSEAPSVLKIPVMPISYADAQPLLEALSGPVAPSSWRGGLPITYHLGPGAAQVRLKIVSDWNLKTLHNVTATIAGRDSPDEWVLRGNHRDAWNYGAWDPLSGHVAMMAEAKAIGALLKQGWRPRRTLVFASWDGEEPGLLGSTEWAETHAAELQRKAVMYLNSDANTRGFLVAGGSHSLQALVNEVSRGVTDPQTGVSVDARLRASLKVAALESDASDEQKRKAKLAASPADLPIEPLGGGTDFTPFLQHLGIAALSIEYGGEGEHDGVYHSIYDSFDHYVKFGDPGLAYGVAEARTAGRILLRVAEAEIIPLQFGGFAQEVAVYLQEVQELTKKKQEASLALNPLLDDNSFVLAADPTRRVLPPAREPEVPEIDFAALDSVVARLKSSAERYDAAYLAQASASSPLPAAKRRQLNALLQGMEQTLITPQGLPGRDWYKHMVYAPGLLTGYGVKTLPGIREPSEAGRWAEVQQYVKTTADVLSGYCDRLDRATTLLKQQR
ncbi:transferrin receptor-like dimerization domain-containing protein [Steroidobacter sp.]|uniref:transferrin receptor-like dimerization domain-containing protein n=1 Tax=Steroidobacter sp. TaxID=1978227 RepID=UPI001A3D1C7C|nr:transferrin receptor-like dimerization domain-containing protein [Steroidobacter sp.]MBL8267530.1 M28 family peptidase [Steroidobacter sp.]